MMDFDDLPDDDMEFDDDDDIHSDEDPINASECIKRLNAQLTLRQRKEVSRSGLISPSLFSRLVAKGKIEYVYVQGSSKKMYYWDVVSRNMGVLTLAEQELSHFAGGGTMGRDDGVELKDEHGNVVKVNRDIFDEYKDSLVDELSECISPIERMNVTDKFWASMFKEFKLRVQMGAYIEVAKVSEVHNSLLPALRDSLYKIAPTIAQQYPAIDKGVVAMIHTTVSRALEELQKALGTNPVVQSDNFVTDGISFDDIEPFDFGNAPDVKDEYESEDEDDSENKIGDGNENR